MGSPIAETGVADVVIIGGGAAGCVLASRLSEDPDRRVILVEAGEDTPPGGGPEEILDGLAPRRPLDCGGRFVWPDGDVRLGHGRSQPRGYEQARVLGGGTSINMTSANRGLPRDYDEWAERGLADWDWAGVLPYFRKLERDLDHDGPLHGRLGPVPIGRGAAANWAPFTHAVARAAAAAGYRDIGDQNAVFDDGYFRPASNSRAGRRVSVAQAYLGADVRARDNLAILTGVHALRLVVAAGAVTGVEIGDPDGGTATLDARETIVSVGALRSPLLLLAAGIGDAAALRALDIPVLADLPGVGRELQDHPAFGVAVALNGDAGRRPAIDTPHQIALRRSSGVAGAPVSDLYHVFGTHPGAAAAAFGYWLNKPASRGRVIARRSAAGLVADVDFNLLAEMRDLAAAVEGFRFIARLIADPAVAPLVAGPTASRAGIVAAGEGVPLGDLLADEAALADFLRGSAKGVWHASGTCRMGPAGDRGAVVGGDGAVHGVRGLRVVDASILPVIPTANIMLPVIMAAEKIADHIRRERA